METLDPEQQTGYLMVRAASELSRAWLAALRRHGINARQFSTLAILVREPTLSQGELARRTLVTAQSMSDSIAALIDADLLTRAPNQPGRAARLEVTTKGRALLRKAYPIVAQREEEAFAALTATERTTLARLLRKVLAI
jgi:DNA-binding MarR family transcriptional regulator